MDRDPQTPQAPPRPKVYFLEMSESKPASDRTFTPDLEDGTSPTELKGQGEVKEFQDEFEVFLNADEDPKQMSGMRRWIAVLVICSASLCVTCTSSIVSIPYDKHN